MCACFCINLLYAMGRFWADFCSTSTLADSSLTLTLLLSYPHGNEMKVYGSCALIITIADF